MLSEADKYWQYSRECTEQALEAETPQLRDQLLDLARMWTEAAVREQMNAKPVTAKPVNAKPVNAKLVNTKAVNAKLSPAPGKRASATVRRTTA
jgi:hypothetical protein